MPAWSGCAEGPLPGLQRAAFSQCPHMVKKEQALVSYVVANPIMGPHPQELI